METKSRDEPRDHFFADAFIFVFGFLFCTGLCTDFLSLFKRLRY